MNLLGHPTWNGTCKLACVCKSAFIRCDLLCFPMQDVDQIIKGLMEEVTGSEVPQSKQDK